MDGRHGLHSEQSASAPTSPAPLPRGLGTLCVGGGAGLTRRQARSAEPCRRRSLSEVTWSMVFRRGLLLPSRQTSVASTAASPVPQGALTGLDPYSIPWVLQRRLAVLGPESRPLWGHSTRNSRGFHPPPPPQRLGAKLGRGQSGGLCVPAWQHPAGPSPGPIQLLTLRGHYLASNLLGAGLRPGSGRILSSCSRAPQTGLADH